mgnify:CR=1 FL=1
MLADYHVHTEFSNDSIYPMEEVVKDAILLGIKDICFTDHVDYGPYLSLIHISEPTRP